MIKRIVSLLVGLGVATVSLPAAASAVWVYVANVTSIYPYGDGSFVLNLSVNDPSCSNTGSPKNYYVAVGATSNGNTITQTWARNILAVSMEAYALNKTVALLYDSATSNCYVSAIKLLP